METNTRGRRATLGARACMARAALAFALTACMFSACGNGLARRGPPADAVSFEFFDSRRAAADAVLSGACDFAASPLSSREFRSLPEAARAKLVDRPVTDGYVSILVNPVPDEAPYVSGDPSSVAFNPFAIPEIRFALHTLIDRNRVVDEAFQGDAEWAFVPSVSGIAGPDADGIAAELGLEEGDGKTGDVEARALESIDAAMRSAAALPELAGTLVTTGGRWRFGDRPVTVTVVVPSSELPEAGVIAKLVAEGVAKAGFEPAILELDEAAYAELLDADPARVSRDRGNLAWNLAIEFRGLPDRRELALHEAFAPWTGTLPGRGVEGRWCYRNFMIDDASRRATDGWYVTDDERGALERRMVELGLRDAVRVVLCSTRAHFVTNKTRLEGSFAAGSAAGPDVLPFLTAWPKRDKDGARRLRAALDPSWSLTDDGALLSPTSAPSETGRFFSLVAALCGEPALVEPPTNGRAAPKGAMPESDAVETRVAHDSDGDGKPEGLVPVEEDALVYDPSTDAWRSDVECRVGPDGLPVYMEASERRSWSRSAMSIPDGVWQTGSKIDVADFMHALAFRAEFAWRDSKDDPVFDEAYAKTAARFLAGSKGTAVAGDGKSVVAYFDRRARGEPERAAWLGALLPAVGPDGSGYRLPWELSEAVMALVAGPSASGTRYALSARPDAVAVDLLDPSCVADLSAVLAGFIAEKRVPSSIARWATREEAVARYAALIAFIDRTGHAFASDGPFALAKRRSGGTSFGLEAFRDGRCPHDGKFWMGLTGNGK